MFKAYNSYNGLMQICCELAINGSGSTYSRNVDVLKETLQCDRITIWAIHSVL